jgi:glycosyltransferase involved in cell wall biosynthesis
MSQLAPGMALVVPCYNEASRFDPVAFAQLLEPGPGLYLVLVDDGSKDETLARLRAFALAHPGKCEVHALARNAGKAEAVRQGMLRALSLGHAVVGFADADLATPPAELLRLAAGMRDGTMDVIIGARVELLGHAIKRHKHRHYLGRVFATVASVALGLPIYDTQCGAKFFRAGPALTQALSDPFASRWSFDVELIGRLMRTTDGVAPLSLDRIREEPLEAWVDVPGSKLNPMSALKSGLELGAIAWRLRHRR